MSDLNPKRPKEKMMPLIEEKYPNWQEMDIPPRQYKGPPYSYQDFDRVFEAMAGGENPRLICMRDDTVPEYGQLMTYIYRNPVLLDRYKAAQKIMAEVMVSDGELVAQGIHEDGSPRMEDPGRSKLILDYIRFRAAAYNRDRFGAKQEIDVTNRIDLGDAMVEAMRLAEERDRRRLERQEVVIEHQAATDN